MELNEPSCTVVAPQGIRYGSAPLLTCGMALALADFEAVVTEEATKHLGRRVVSVSHAGTCSCNTSTSYMATTLTFTLRATA